MFEIDKLKEKLIGRKKEKTATGAWIVYNFGNDLEFAECNLCGWEQPYTQRYPTKCPKCGARMVNEYLAEDYDQVREYGGYIGL